MEAKVMKQSNSFGYMLYVRKKDLETWKPKSGDIFEVEIVSKKGD